MSDIEQDSIEENKSFQAALVTACIKRDSESIHQLCTQLEVNLPYLVLVLSESLNELLTSGDYASGFYLLRQKIVSEVKDPYIDYTRVVVLLLMGDTDFAEQYLNASLNLYPQVQYLRDLREAINEGIDPKLLIL